MTRVSVECGPSVTASLYKDRRIDALSLSVLSCVEDSDLLLLDSAASLMDIVHNHIPVIEADPTFQNEHFVEWMEDFEEVSSVVLEEEEEEEMGGEIGEEEEEEEEEEAQFQWTYNLFLRNSYSELISTTKLKREVSIQRSKWG